jgi:predicted secreted Zn-dependent protease
MESKLQKLENAWNEFLMGIANNEVLKGAVDFLTKMVEGINSATQAISGGNGLLKSVISLTTAIAGI